MRRRQFRPFALRATPSDRSLSACQVVNNSATDTTNAIPSQVLSRWKYALSTPARILAVNSARTLTHLTSSQSSRYRVEISRGRGRGAHIFRDPARNAENHTGSNSSIPPAGGHYLRAKLRAEEQRRLIGRSLTPATISLPTSASRIQRCIPTCHAHDPAFAGMTTCLRDNLRTPA